MATLTDWSGTAPTVHNSVHLGVWTNWSRGKTMGATLTLDRSHGTLLIAFTAVFVGIVTNRLWRIACYVFYRCYSTPMPRDALHHQRQAILRNSNSAASALWTIVQLTWAWQNVTTRTIVRVLPAFLTAASCVIAFTVAGGYSSQISSALKNEVLLNGTNCGIVNAPRDADLMKLAGPYDSKRVADAANYAQQCYSNTLSTFDCTYFVKNNLRGTIDGSAPCPFSDEICRSNSFNIILDTGYIDSIEDLGMNSPQDESIKFRTVLQCAPLETHGYTSNKSTPTDNFTEYYYGTFLNGLDTQDATFTVESLDSQYWRQADNPQSGDGRNMILSTQLVYSEYRGMSPDTSDFAPIPALTRSDGDLMLVFLAGNGVEFLSSTNDPWYRGNVPAGAYGYIGKNDSIPAYHPEEAASPLGCVQQYQFCNPSLPEDRRCGPLASWAESVVEAAVLFNLTVTQAFGDEYPSQRVASKFKWLLTQLFHATTGLHSILLILGSKALDSQRLLSEGVLPELPENQWQLDVSRWFAIFLASIQAGVVNSALGPADKNLSQYTIWPPNEHVKGFCNNQKILSTEYVSFTLFGLCFTYVTGVLIILVSYILEPIYACLYRRHKYGEYTYLEWTTTETLQLQRTSYQGIGSGTWLGHTEAIPRTTTGEKLSNLPLSYAMPGGDSVNRNNLHPRVAQMVSLDRVSLDDLLLESESSLVGTDSSKSTILKTPAPI